MELFCDNRTIKFVEKLIPLMLSDNDIEWVSCDFDSNLIGFKMRYGTKKIKLWLEVWDAGEEGWKESTVGNVYFDKNDKPDKTRSFIPAGTTLTNNVVEFWNGTKNNIIEVLRLI